ncbi:DUF3289 family protein [Pantoea sp. LMR881]|uniref:DUF3289 family protein n=1 Tax=Pantoea sp. LMR881 TaxID=3014336 RepID=UPI0022AE6890|nr:DUF3289 family protein [Pantoea sp. LMR881]MCZ4059656.1 DUF3289 family protein [Pantoea sp. LMR881]
MTALQFPCTIFKTQNRFNDYGAKDMRCGDLSAAQLKTQYHLVDVSTRACPYTLTKITPFSQPQSMFHGSRGLGDKLTLQQCASILFDEFRYLSQSFSVYGPYRHLIEQMITHMQYGDGLTFSNMQLDCALKAHILNDSSQQKSTRILLERAFVKNIDWTKNIYPSGKKNGLTEAILRGKLPKFDRLQDTFNGMGITVHDTWATEITLKSLQIANDQYRAVVHYKIQDHFGLDSEDITKFKFNQFRLFRIWFVLQRYSAFGFQPFMTNIEATVEISGDRSESQP